MTENTLTHQIGFTRTNCAWIALNLLLNILMCYLVLQISPRPNETSMNPYYGPNTIGDLPRDFDKVLAQVEKGATIWSDAITNQYFETMKGRPTRATDSRPHGNVAEMRILQFPGNETLHISWRELPVVFVFGNPLRFYLTPIAQLIGEDLAPQVGATWASGMISIAMETLNVVENAKSVSDLAALNDLMTQWYDFKDNNPLVFDDQKPVIVQIGKYYPQNPIRAVQPHQRYQS
jgi:hypothetical protein